MAPRVRARSSLTAIAIAGLGALAGCSPGPGPTPSGTALGDGAVTVASFDFPESVVLAELYGQALRARGYEVRLDLNVGPRELVQPALAAGLVEFVPEYAGTAVEFLSLGEEEASDDLPATRASLARALDGGPLVALASAPAQDANAVVVTRKLAAERHLRTISDLLPHARDLSFGGPPGCDERPFCLEGLTETYRLRFARFLPLDVGGPLTHQALVGGHADVGLLFTTDPQIERDGLMVLTDDRHLQPAENVTPVVRRELVERWGRPFTSAVDAVSARLTTAALQRINAQVAAGSSPRAVAASWLESEGLA
jgi:osmoprotectant transport system substrate-binding protein